MAASPEREPSPDWLREFQSPAAAADGPSDSSPERPSPRSNGAEVDQAGAAAEAAARVLQQPHNAAEAPGRPSTSSPRVGSKTKRSARRGLESHDGAGVSQQAPAPAVIELSDDRSERSSGRKKRASVGGEEGGSVSKRPRRASRGAGNGSKGPEPGRRSLFAALPPLATPPLEDDSAPAVEAAEQPVLGPAPPLGSPAKVVKSIIKLGDDDNGLQDVAVEPEDELPAVPNGEATVLDRKGKQWAASVLPLFFADKVQQTKALVECEGDTLDVSGDMGAIGRFSMRKSKDKKMDDHMLLDLKGCVYRATIVPSNTFLVVNIGQTVAKVEAVINDFVQLEPEVNTYESETVIEGAIDEIAAHSDEEVVRVSQAAAEAGGQPNAQSLAGATQEGKPEVKLKVKHSRTITTRVKVIKGGRKVSHKSAIPKARANSKAKLKRRPEERRPRAIKRDTSGKAAKVASQAKAAKLG